MEGKVIFYIIIGIGYLLYSLYQKGLKGQETQEKKKQQSKPVSPPTRSVFEQALEEIKQQQNVAKEFAAQQKANPIFVEKGKDVFVKQIINPQFEEGKTAYNLYERKMTEEENRATEAENKRISKSSKVFEITEESTNKIEFDARQALISSIIFERKF